jgi:hypothetical protein
MAWKAVEFPEKRKWNILLELHLSTWTNMAASLFIRDEEILNLSKEYKRKFDFEISFSGSSDTNHDSLL